jgi:glycosyltransferase involved in cell wall biosynthesis
MIISSSQLVSNPLVSVIIPSYNRPDTVGTTIESVINQRCDFDVEIIIGDDCSTAETRCLLHDYQQRYPSQIVLLFHEQNTGLGANWASCAKICRGEFIANCDNDDYWHNPDKLRLQVGYFRSNPGVGVVHTDYATYNQLTDKHTNIIVSKRVIETPAHISFYNGQFKVGNATMMYRRTLVTRHVNLDDFINGRFTLQDWPLWVILAKYTTFYCLPVVTATICIHNESVTRPKDYTTVKARFMKEKEICIYLANLFPEELHFDEEKYNTYIQNILLNLAYQRFDFRAAKGFIEKMPRHSVKIFCAAYKLTFYIFAIGKKLRRKL